jgi:hypothetical protein
VLGSATWDGAGPPPATATCGSSVDCDSKFRGHKRHRSPSAARKHAYLRGVTVAPVAANGGLTGTHRAHTPGRAIKQAGPRCAPRPLAPAPGELVPLPRIVAPASRRLPPGAGCLHAHDPDRPPPSSLPAGPYHPRRPRSPGPAPLGRRARPAARRAPGRPRRLFLRILVGSAPSLVERHWRRPLVAGARTLARAADGATPSPY